MSKQKSDPKVLSDFEKLNCSFKTIGFRPIDLEMIYSTILAIHLLNQVEFDEHQVEGNIEGIFYLDSRQCVVKYFGIDCSNSNFFYILVPLGSQITDPSLVSAIAHLLGISASDLSRVLTISNLSTRGEVISKSNTISESISIKKAFAKGLYSRLFDYVVQVVNKLMSYSLQVTKQMKQKKFAGPLLQGRIRTCLEESDQC